MKHSNYVWSALVLTGAVVVSSCSNGGAVSNAAPRISAVPTQSTAGGTAFNLDLSTYVTDREGVTLARLFGRVGWRLVLRQQLHEHLRHDG